ncbi:MAG: response regulator, partial [Taibaiella sp.]|nr:response regulator [Taibaiella sp.]
MHTMNVLVADDEPIARDILKDYISRIPGLRLAGTCKNAGEAMNALKENPIDLILLDINMPGMTGIELLKQLTHPPLVILTTAYTQYAVESYELDIVDYLLKPFSFERFEKAIHKAVTTLDRKTPGENIFVKVDGKLVK